jgi:GrpB-like predicted nucleotidyltransferase (UPF0157 family)
MPSPVEIVEYDPAWPATFEALRREIAHAMGDLALAIEHVGSTAVPGLAAKPIIDMDVVVRSPADIPAAIERLAPLGYDHRGDLGIPGREAFTTPPDTPPHHLYVVAVNIPAYRQHILFRDYLRRHPEEARIYETMKRAAAARYRHDRLAYTEAKTDMIGEMLRRAEAETGSNCF